MRELDTGTAFFRRSEVVEAIEEIRRSHNLVVYAGAGVSIDRSGLSWGKLVENLLAPHVPKAKARRDFVERSGPLFAASAAHQFYIDTSPEPVDKRGIDARQRMVDALRPLLYGPSLWRGGELANAIADFIYIWHNSESAGASGTIHNAALVTTNYDDYLFAALLSAHEIARSQAGSQIPGKTVMPKVRFPTQTDPLVEQRPEFADWLSQDLPLASEVSCIHLHGYLPSSHRRGSEHRFPVVSEHDYYRTAEYSEKTLTALMTTSNAIMVGASLTDPPLLRALEATRESSHKRWALIGMERGTKGDPTGADQRRMVKSRLSALRVAPIFVDFHVQQAQFFRELIAASKITAPRSKYNSPRAQLHYYARLGSWWKKLRLDSSRVRTEEMQFEVHDFLSEFVLPECRTILEARDERLKVEVWIRWNPSSERVFRLFGSTVGVWVDQNAMRSEEISLGTESIIVDTFREGRPQLRSDASYGGRWPTVLAVPVWSESHQTEFVTSVIILASQSPSETSALDERGNRASLADCTRFLQQVGNFLTEPSSWRA